MRVVIRNGDAEVELDHQGEYLPSIMRDLCDHARKTWAHAFEDVEEDNVDIEDDR